MTPAERVAAWAAQDEREWTPPPLEEWGRKDANGNQILPSFLKSDWRPQTREEHVEAAAMALLSILPDELHGDAMALLMGQESALADAHRRKLLEWSDALVFAMSEDPWQHEVMMLWREALR